MAARHFERTSIRLIGAANAGRSKSTIGIELTAVDMHVTAFARPSATDTCSPAIASSARWPTYGAKASR